MSVPTQRDKRLDAVLVKNASTRKPVHTSDKFGFFFGCAYPNPKNLKNDEDVKPEELDTLLKDMIGGPMFIEHEGYDQEYIVNKGADAVKDVRKSSNSIGTIHDAWVCPKTGKIETIFSLNSSSLANKAREQMKKGGLGELSIGYLITHSHGKRKLHFTELSVCDTGRQDNTNIYYSCSAKSNTIGPKPSLSLNSLQGKVLFLAKTTITNTPSLSLSLFVCLSWQMSIIAQGSAGVLKQTNKQNNIFV